MSGLLARLSTPLVPQAVKAAASSEHSKLRPVNEEYTNVGFFSLETSAGPLTSAVSMMRNGMLAVNVPALPERSLPRTLKVCDPSATVAVCEAIPLQLVAGPSSIEHRAALSGSFVPQPNDAPRSVVVEAVNETPLKVGPTCSGKPACGESANVPLFPAKSVIVH